MNRVDILAWIGLTIMALFVWTVIREAEMPNRVRQLPCANGKGTYPALDEPVGPCKK